MPYSSDAIAFKPACMAVFMRIVEARSTSSTDTGTDNLQFHSGPLISFPYPIPLQKKDR